MIQLLQDNFKPELIDNIKKQADILEYKLLNNINSVITDCMITDFLISILHNTNQVTSFDYNLKIDDSDPNPITNDFKENEFPRFITALELLERDRINTLRQDVKAFNNNLVNYDLQLSVKPKLNHGAGF